MCTPLRAAGCALNLATGAWVFSLNTAPKPSNDAPAEERRESPGASARALVLVLVTIGCLGRGSRRRRADFGVPRMRRGRLAVPHGASFGGERFFRAPTRPWRCSSSHCGEAWMACRAPARRRHFLLIVAVWAALVVTMAGRAATATDLTIARRAAPPCSYLRL